MAARERWDSPWVALLLDSHRRLLGRELAGTASARLNASWLYHRADFCLLAHDGDDDPRFGCANLRALWNIHDAQGRVYGQAALFATSSPS